MLHPIEFALPLWPINVLFIMLRNNWISKLFEIRYRHFRDSLQVIVFYSGDND